MKIENDKIDEQRLRQLKQQLPKMNNFVNLESLTPKLKALMIEEISKNPIHLSGCQSPFFFEGVGSYLVNVQSSVIQK